MCTQEQGEVYEAIFRECITDFRVGEGGEIHGFCHSLEEVDRLLDRLKSRGFCYYVRDSSSKKQTSDSSKRQNFFFQQLQGNVHINFFGTAFCVESICNRQCILGPKYYKKRGVAVPNHLEDHVNPKKKRLLLMDTKKHGCPATLWVKCIRVFPGYTLKSMNVRWQTKAKVIDQLKRDMDLPNKPDSFLRYYIVASPESHHTHSTECVKVNGNVHPMVAGEIKSLVQNGTTSVQVIKLALEVCVKNYFTGTDAPERMNVMFYPSEQTIYSHIYRALYVTKKSVLDQDRLQDLVTGWCSESSDHSIFFRQFSDREGEVQSLLFCYQNRWQKDLLKKYGTSCLLDATYKTTKYEIPLFFITVKTNVNYVVVGFFFVQIENTTSIHEALNIFKDWNRDWNPNYWMTDYSESEINAIMHAFPRTRVYLCSFHREQAWQRWLKKGGNLTVTDDREMVLALWRQLASSPTEQIFNLRKEEMRGHAVFTRNPKALKYLKNKWLSESSKWVKAFEEKGILDTITTTNGVEALNRVVKKCFLQHSIDKTLTGVIKVLVNSFLPHLIGKYSKENSVVKSYNKDVPLFLQKKTRKFAMHVMSKYSLAEAEYSEKSAVTVIGEGLFCVKSMKSNSHYNVNFDEPSCTCENFKRYKFPCKHFCAVFIFFPEWNFNQINEGYRNSPLISLDEKYGLTFSRSSFGQTAEARSLEETICDEEAGTISSEESSCDEEEAEIPPISETTRHPSELKEARELCKYVENLTYNCNDVEAVRDVIGWLKKCATKLEMSNPKVDGLPITVASGFNK